MTDAGEAARIAEIADGLSDAQKELINMPVNSKATDVDGLLADWRDFQEMGILSHDLSLTPDGIAVAAMLTTQGEPTE